MKSSSLNKQQGWTMWSGMIALAIIGFFLTVAFRVGPPYITNYTVQETIRALQNEPELSSMSPYDVRRAIERRFDVNQVNVIQAVCRRKDEPCLKIEKTKSEMTIDGNYEVRVPVMGNVDAVVKFEDNTVTIPIRGG